MVALVRPLVRPLVKKLAQLADGLPSVPSLSALSLTASSVSEGASVGAVVGQAQGQTSGSTVTLTDDAGGLFALVDGYIEVAGALDYETAASHEITLRETLAEASNTPRDTTLTIEVTNVLEVTLAALSLSASSLPEGSAEDTVVGTVQGLSSGSTWTLADDAGGRFKKAGNSIVAGATETDYEAATSHDITIQEVNADGSNSPRETTLTISVSNAAEVTLGALSLSASSISEGASNGTVIGQVQGTSAGSSLSLVDDAGGLFSLSGGYLYKAGALDYETATSHTVTIRETHPDGSNSPRDTDLTVTVTNVLEVTLAALSLSASTIEEGAAAGTTVGALQGTSSGSTLSLVDDAGGRFALSGSNIVAGLVETDYATAQSHDITVRETHADGANSPRDSVLTISVTEASTGTVSNQMAPVGALDLASFSGYQIVDDAGDPVTGVSDAGTGTASGYDLSAGGLISHTTNGSLSAQNGNTIDITCDQGTATITLDVQADTYVFTPNDSAYGELGTILAQGWPAISGQTLKGRAGTQYVDGNYFSLYPSASPATSYVTITSLANDNKLAKDGGDETDWLQIKVKAGQNNWWGTKYIEFYRIGWISDWTPETHSVNNPNIELQGAYGYVRWRECNIDGQWRALNETYGPAFNADDFTYRGFVSTKNDTSPTGPVELIDNDIHDYWRAYMINLDAPNVRIVGNHHHHCTVDHGLVKVDDGEPAVTVTSAEIDWNTFSDPLVVVPPSMDVLSVDTANDRITVDDPDARLGTSVTINFTSESGALPTGVTVNTDYPTTRVSQSGGQTVLEFTTLDLTDAGSSVVVRKEPAHADFLQAVIFNNSDNPTPTVSGLKVRGNRILGNPANDPGGEARPQGFLFEDISVETVENFYYDSMFAGNLIYSANAHGISFFNPVRGIVSDNTAVAPSGTVYGDQPRVRILQQHSWVGENNVMTGNVARTVSSYISGDVDALNTELEPANYGSSGLFAGTGGYAPTTIAEMTAAFARTDLNGVIDYDARTYDLPSINDTSAISFTDVSDATTSTLTTSAPVQVTSITNSEGNPSAYGAQVSVQGEGSPQFRITADEAGTTVITDWTSTPAIIEAGEWVQTRTTSADTDETERRVFTRVGSSYDTWVVSTGAVAATAPSAFTSGDWGAVTGSGESEIDFTITTLPSDGGSAITDLEYSTDNGATWASLAGATTGTYTVDQDSDGTTGTLTADTSYTTMVRAVNAVGNGANSDAKAVTTGATAAGPLFFDDFSTDTSASYTADGGALTYNAGNTSLNYDPTSSFEGFSTPAISLADGDYVVSVTIQNNDPGGGSNMVCDVVYGSTLHGENFGASSLESRVGQNSTATVTTTVSVTGGTLYVTPRVRGDVPGSTFDVLDITVTAA